MTTQTNGSEQQSSPAAEKGPPPLIQIQRVFIAGGLIDIPTIISEATRKFELQPLPDLLSKNVFIHLPGASSSSRATLAHKSISSVKYDSSTKDYTIVHYVPLMHIVGDRTFGDISTDPTDMDVDGRVTPNHTYIRLWIRGKYERRYLKPMCRVEEFNPEVIVFPVCMTYRNQLKVLTAMPTEHASALACFREQNLYYASAVSVQQLNKAHMNALRPHEASYVERPNATHQSPHEMHANTEHLLLQAHANPFSPRPTSSRTVKTITKLASFNTPVVRVRELDSTHTVHQEHQNSLYSWKDEAKRLWNRNRNRIRTRREGTISKLLHKVSLEKYVGSDTKLAVVALLPHNHLTHSLSVVGVARFSVVNAHLVTRKQEYENTIAKKHTTARGHLPRNRFGTSGPASNALVNMKAIVSHTAKAIKHNVAHPGTYTKTSGTKTIVAHVVLEGVEVDYKFVVEPADTLRTARHPVTSHGIYEQFVEAAVGYVHKLHSTLDIKYHGSDPMLVHTLMSKPIGFAEAPPRDPASLLEKAALLTNHKSHKLVKKSHAPTCHTWKECVQHVQREHPALPFKQQLVLARGVYSQQKNLKKTNRRRRSGSHHHPDSQIALPSPKKSKRPVTARVGASILVQFYSQKFLEPLGLSSCPTRPEVESALMDDKQKPFIVKYVRAIRTHLARRRR